MANQYKNKIIYGNQTLMDITDTTATENDVLEGEVFYSAGGARSVGTLGDATQSTHGLMSATDKTKLDGFLSANNYLTSHQDISGKANTADLATVATSGSYVDLLNKPDLSVYLTSVPIMVGATSNAAGTAGLAPAPTSADVDKFLAGDGTYKSGGLPMVVLSYGNSTWNDFITAYNNHVIVYCRASSNSNPATGVQGRMAFMAYVNNGDAPTEVEFQYYRSMSSHSATQMGDQVYIYKLNKNSGWSVTVREAGLKQIVEGTGISVSYSNNKITINTDIAAATTSTQGLMSASDKSKLDGIAEGATANIGTITDIVMNGTSKGTSGVIDLGTVITAHQDISGKLDASLKGTANGVAELDANGKVIASQLPSYTDTTYTITQDLTDGHKITLTGTDGTSTTITIPDNNTTYSNATQSVDGLMSSSDKTSLDDIKTALTVDASTTTPGRVNTGEQEFAGKKTFSSLKSRYTMNVHGTNNANFNVRLSAAPTKEGADGLIGTFSASCFNLKSRLEMRVFGVNSQGQQINYYDEYRLPETDVDKSETNFYNILTTKAVTLDASAQAAARGNIRAVSDADIAIMANGNTHAAITIGQAVIVRNHSTLADGLYWANTFIDTNATLSTSNLTADTSGGLNKLKGDIASLKLSLFSMLYRNVVTANQGVDITQNFAYQIGNIAFLFLRIKSDNGFNFRLYVGTLKQKLRPIDNIQYTCAMATIYDSFSLLNDSGCGYVLQNGNIYVDYGGVNTIKEINICISYPINSQPPNPVDPGPPGDIPPS